MPRSSPPVISGARHPRAGAAREATEQANYTESEAPRSEPLLRRLNGRPQACDPCRSRKVACDNAQPICDRCRRKRKQTAPCVYTVSDQTSQPPGRARQRIGSAGHEGSSASAAAASATTTAPASTNRESPRSEKTRNGHRLWARRALHTYNVQSFADTPVVRRARVNQNSNDGKYVDATSPARDAYLGFFSYTTVFDEARTSLTLLNGGQGLATTTSDVVPSIRSATRRAPRPGDGSSNLGAVNREMCLHVLRSLPDPTSTSTTRLRPLSLLSAQLWGRVATARILETLQQRYGDVLGSFPRDEAGLQAMAEDICANSARPFDSDLVDPAAFLDQFAGEKLRWESIGLVYVFRELAPDVNGSGVVPPPEELGRAWEVWPETGRACLKLCIELARSFTDGNSILAFLCYRLVAYDSYVFGDSSLTHWMTHGEAVALATAMGLHALPDPPDYKPCLASEIKRRIACSIFNLDKVSPAFHGRPPMLGHRYVSSPLPMALPDEALLAGGEEIDRAVACISSDGWNMEEELGRTTGMRCNMMLNRLKEELLEIALGNPQRASLELIQDIKRREQQVYDAFPDKCKYSDEHLDEVHLSVDILFSRLLIHLDHLQNQLFAERLIARHGGADDGGLLFVSFEILRHALIFWMHNSRFEGLSVDFIWIAMAFGAPGGGVLCMELLFPTLPNRPIPYTNATSPRITRSAIVQQLSLLVGFLSWAGPAAPNADQAASCKAVIQSVLDHALNGGGPIHQTAAGEGDALAALGGFEPGQLDLGFDLLGTFDWLRPDETALGFGCS